MSSSNKKISSSEELKRKKNQLKPFFSETGWTILWKDKLTDEIWESVFEGRYDELEYLVCLSEEEAKNKFPQAF